MTSKKSIIILIYSPTLEELKEVQKVLPNAQLNLIAYKEGVSDFLYDKGTLANGFFKDIIGKKGSQ